MIVAPLFWEWFNVWLLQFLKDLYHEIKMVALRGVNGYGPHGCSGHVGQPELATSTSNGAGNSTSGRGIQMQYLPVSGKHESSRYTNCVAPSNSYRLLTQSPQISYPRASTPHRAECYHPSGTAGGGFLPGAGASQPNLRAQPTPQPSAPPAPQDMSKTSMAGHNYVSQQSQNAQARPQYPNFPYRAQHGTRPNTHPRQQQPYLAGTSGGTAGPVVYHHPTLVFQPHMGLPQTYQQPRSSTTGFYPYMAPYLGYSTPTSHTPPYYYSNSQQLAGGGVAAGAGRGAGGPLVGPQPAAPTAPAPAIAHAPPPPHMHSAMPGIRPNHTKRSHRVPIIHPDAHQEVLTELYNDDTYLMSGESSERQTPQPDPPSHSIAEEFSRLVNESIANQSVGESAMKPVFGHKSVEMTPPPVAITMQPQTNAINSINNNNIVKSDILNVNENKTSGPDVVGEPSETPVVSAISDSPVIVPKMPTNIKQLQKTSEQSQTLALDNNNKSANTYKNKQQKNKPHVPQAEDAEKPVETAAPATGVTVSPVAIAPSVPVAETGAEPPAPVQAAAPATAPTFTPTPTPNPTPIPTPVATPTDTPNFVPNFIP
ncbi:unnamed protein product [Parnassius apollo]|uniref:(apollo) hypothetical protein n=1 Tax=Parnassius apollo TaxID=110799 RepID=A0A8S3XAE2_PARAO|nr:unnamed protein product [Parnassius apollo]